MEQLIHFKGFSACSKCTGRFKIWDEAEGQYDEPVHEAIILFHIGYRPNTIGLQTFCNILGEFDQQRMPHCCLLVQVLSNNSDYGNFSKLLDAYDPELFQAQCGSNVSQAPVLREIRLQQPPNWIHPIMGRAEGPTGYDFSSSPSQHEFDEEDDEIDDSLIPCWISQQHQQIVKDQQKTEKMETLTNKKITIKSGTPKRRKSNRSRKSSKKEKLKKSF